MYKSVVKGQIHCGVTNQTVGHNVTITTATNYYFGCQLIYGLFFSISRLVMIILAASVSTLVLRYIIRAN